MSKIDHHLHTTRYSPDSIIEPKTLIKKAIEAGLDGVVITEHDNQWSDAELEELQSHGPSLAVLSGIEVTTRQGDFLVYGLPTEHRTFPGIELAVLLRMVEEHSAAIVAAHPFRWNQRFDLLVEEFGPVFDGLELVSNNVTRDERALTEAILKQYPMGATGSSDAHEPAYVGCYFTNFPATIHSMSDFVAALRSKKGKPGHNARASRLACGPVEH